MRKRLVSIDTKKKEVKTRLQGLEGKRSEIDERAGWLPECSQIAELGHGDEIQE